MTDVTLSSVVGGGGVPIGGLVEVSAALATPPENYLFTASAQTLLQSAWPALFDKYGLIAAQNGTVWTDIAAPGGATTTMRSASYENGVWIAVGNSGDIWRSTDDGLTWTDIASPGGATIMFGVSYGNGVWIAVGDSGDIWRSTDDGLTWTDIAAPGGATTTMLSVFYGSGVWIAVGSSGDIWRNDAFTYNIATQFFVPQVTHADSADVQYAVRAA